MNPEKKKVLKRLVKMRLLAELTDINETYLSQIINGHRSAGRDLSCRLAHAANLLSVQKEFFTPQDFRDE